MSGHSAPIEEIRDTMVDETLSAPSLVRIVDELNRCLPDLPPPRTA